MQGNKVEICGVDTARLPVLTHKQMMALFERIHAGDDDQSIDAFFQHPVQRLDEAVEGSDAHVVGGQHPAAHGFGHHSRFFGRGDVGASGGQDSDETDRIVFLLAVHDDHPCSFLVSRLGHPGPNRLELLWR